MIRVTIGNESRTANEISQQWLCNQINGRRNHHEHVCVRVIIKECGVGLQLQTPGCPIWAGGSGPLTHTESKIVDLWHKHKLDQPDFGCEGVYAFLGQVVRFF